MNDCSITSCPEDGLAIHEVTIYVLAARTGQVQVTLHLCDRHRDDFDARWVR